MPNLPFRKHRVTLLAALVGVMASVCHCAQGRTTALHNCVSNLRIIEAAIEEWALVNKVPATNSYSLSDTNIINCLRQQVMPECTEGGVYLAGKTVQDEVTCTVHGSLSTYLAIYEERLRRERQQFITRVSIIMAMIGLGVVISIGWWRRTRRISNDQLRKSS